MKIRGSIDRSNEPSRPYQIRHSQGMNHESELLTDSCMVGIVYLVAIT